jgi:hypothetical protein
VTTPTRRLVGWTAALLAMGALLAGCGQHARRASAPRRLSDGPVLQGPLSAETPSASTMALLRMHDAVWRTNFHRHAVPLGDFEPGGPPRDGIPPIDRPRYVGVRAADRFLALREPVLAVVVRGRARAYPFQILVWHEIVNDRLGGRPIAVIYCPLCNSALVFDRRVGGRTLSFGTTGKLRDSDLVMWDRETQSWWQQFTGEALVGDLTGRRLRALDSQTLSWGDFRRRYPRATVLSRRTGFDRPYGVNPYEGYDRRPGRPDLYGGHLDPRLPPRERVVAVFAGGRTAVIPFSVLARHPVIVGRLAGKPFVVFFEHGVASPLDATAIRAGRDIGTAGAFDPRVRGRRLRFAARGSAFVDAQTGTRWDITGHALTGPLRGAQLRQLRHDEQFWFALAAFVPHARLGFRER